MKKVSLLLLLLLPVYCLHAQLDSTRKAQHDRLLNQLFAAQRTSYPGAKTTGAAERLTSMNVYQDAHAAGTWIRTDSARLTYSSIHESVFNMDNMGYNLFFYLNISNPMYKNMVDYTPPVMYDSLYYYRYASGSSIRKICRRKYTNDLITDFRFQTNVDTTDVDFWYRYNPKGSLISARSFTITPHPNNYWWNGDYYAYNAKGQIIEDSSVVSDFADTNSTTRPDQKWEYVYNTSGALTNVSGTYYLGSWYSLGTFTITYSATNQVNAIYQNSELEPPFQVDSFSYSSGISYYTFHSDSLFNTTTGLMDFQESDQKYTNASGLVDSMIYLKPNYKEVHYYSYTALGNPRVDSVVVFRGGLLDSEAVVHYFYKPVPLGVQPVYAQVADVQIYPNPTTGILYVRSAVVKSPLLLTVYNAQGRLISSTTLSMTSGNAQFSLQNSLPGVYFLIITDEKGTIIKRQTIIKQ